MADFFIQMSATIVGAIIAAAVAFALARQSNLAIEKRDLTQRKQMQKSALLKLQLRASLLTSDVTSTMGTIDRMFIDANKAGRTGWPKHARIQSIIGSYEKISFPIEELEPLIEAKEFDLVQGLVEISMRHQSFLEAISTYSRLRLELKNKVTIANADNNVLGANLDAHEYKQLQPFLIELETLIDQAIKMGRDIETQARAITAKIGPAARLLLKDPTFPKLTFAEETVSQQFTVRSEMPS
jgi:hypothetical protein